MIGWIDPPAMPILNENDVHVWRASLDISASRLDALFQVLSPDEQTRATRFYFEKDRDRFIAARGTLRCVLSNYAQVQPSLLQFHYSESGKPFLVAEQGGETLHFNVSHSQTLALYAIAHNRPVGIDVEYIRAERDRDAIAERFFTPNEVAVLQTLNSELRIRGFFNCWTRKEAYVKATGKGLSIPLDQFEVSLHPEEPAQLISTAWNPPDAKRWSLADLDVGEDYAGAIAVEGRNWQMQQYRYPN